MEEASQNPFGAWIKLKRVAKKWSVRKLAEEAKVCSYSLISQLENNTYVGKKGRPMQVDENIVIGLATALGESVNEALKIAGYAEIEEKPRVNKKTEKPKENEKLTGNKSELKKSELKKPTNFAEFAEALESMGIFDLQMFGGEAVFETFTAFDYELFLEKMRNDVLIEVKRKGAR